MANLDAHVFYTAVVKALSAMQDKELENMANGNSLGNSAEEAGLRYTAAHARLTTCSAAKLEIQALWSKMTGSKTGDQNEGDADGGKPTEDVY